MKNTFKILLLLLFTTTLYSLESNEYFGPDVTLIENDISTKCGFLEVKSRFRTDKLVRAKKDGCFRWVFLKNGKVTHLSDVVIIKEGESKRGFSKNGQTVEINCHCRRKKANY